MDGCSGSHAGRPPILDTRGFDSSSSSSGPSAKPNCTLEYISSSKSESSSSYGGMYCGTSACPASWSRATWLVSGLVARVRSIDPQIRHTFVLASTFSYSSSNMSSSSTSTHALGHSTYLGRGRVDIFLFPKDWLFYKLRNYDLGHLDLLSAGGKGTPTVYCSSNIDHGWYIC